MWKFTSSSPCNPPYQNSWCQSGKYQMQKYGWYSSQSFLTLQLHRASSLLELHKFASSPRQLCQTISASSRSLSQHRPQLHRAHLPPAVMEKPWGLTHHICKLLSHIPALRHSVLLSNMQIWCTAVYHEVSPPPHSSIHTTQFLVQDLLNRSIISWALLVITKSSGKTRHMQWPTSVSNLMMLSTNFHSIIHLNSLFIL